MEDLVVELEPQPRHAIANYSQAVSSMLPLGKYKRGKRFRLQPN